MTPRTTRYVGGSDSSKAGADAAETRAKTQAKRILSFIEDAGPKMCTADDVYDWINVDVDQGCPEARLKRVSKNIVRARLCALHDQGLIADSGERRVGVHGIKIKAWISAAIAGPEVLAKNKSHRLQVEFSRALRRLSDVESVVKLEQFLAELRPSQ